MNTKEAPLWIETDEGDILPPDVPDQHGWQEVSLDPDYHFSQASNTQPIPPMAVKLTDRAFALMSIMDYLNTRNRTRGMSTVADNPTSDFRDRYGISADDVYGAAVGKTNEKAGQARAALDVLNATDAMKAHGYSESDIARSRAELLDDIRNSYGQPGMSRARKKLVDRAMRAAGLPKK